MSARDGGALCVECGLCCSGAVFSGVRLSDEETEWARRRALPIVRAREEPPLHVLRHPCPLLRGRLCDAYEERPAICREFECKLLRRVVAGEVALDEALARVRALQSMREDLEAALGPERPAAIFWAYAALLADPETPADLRAKAEALYADLLPPWRALRAAIDADIRAPGEAAT